MSKKEAAEYRAKITNDAGIVRGKVPSPLIRELGGRPGDYMVFNYDGASKVAMSISRTRASRKTAAKKAQKGRTGKADKRR